MVCKVLKSTSWNLQLSKLQALKVSKLLIGVPSPLTSRAYYRISRRNYFLAFLTVWDILLQCLCFMVRFCYRILGTDSVFFNFSRSWDKVANWCTLAAFIACIFSDFLEKLFPCLSRSLENTPARGSHSRARSRRRRGPAVEQAP